MPVRYIRQPDEIPIPPSFAAEEDAPSPMVSWSGRGGFLAAIPSLWPDDELVTAPGAIVEDESGPVYVPPDLGETKIVSPWSWDQADVIPGPAAPPDETGDRVYIAPWQFKVPEVPSLWDPSDLPIPTGFALDEDYAVIPIRPVPPFIVPSPSLWDQAEPNFAIFTPDEDIGPPLVLAVRPPARWIIPSPNWDAGDIANFIPEEDYDLSQLGVSWARWQQRRSGLVILEDTQFAPSGLLPIVMSGQLRIVSVFAGQVSLAAAFRARLRLNPQPTEP